MAFCRSLREPLFFLPTGSEGWLLFSYVAGFSNICVGFLLCFSADAHISSRSGFMRCFNSSRRFWGPFVAYTFEFFWFIGLFQKFLALQAAGCKVQTKENCLFFKIATTTESIVVYGIWHDTINYQLVYYSKSIERTKNVCETKRV